MVADNRSHGSDDGRNGRFPSEETLALLRDALVRFLAGEIDDEQVCEALSTLAREARSRQLQAEDMLVAFKTVWNALPEVGLLPERAEQQRLLGRLITLCIDSYYRG